MNYFERDTFGIYKNKVGAMDGHSPHDLAMPNLMGANTLIGTDVHNESDEDLGEIKEFMLDMRTGNVAYAVLSFGGFMGMGNKLFAVPWTALRLDTTNKCFVLHVEKAQLESAPGFDKDKWPDMTDPAWVESIHAFYRTPVAEGKLHS
jgi:sporulation protein YlmC with PRC-barrel domain